jgi:hypothetical protein
MTRKKIVQQVQVQEEKDIQAPADTERFTASVAAKQAEQYPFLSRHVFGGVTYQVTAILTDGDGISIEFVRVP